MRLSVLELYTIGIGPSSSHTVGPMRAAERFARQAGTLKPARLRVELFGSLALTGKGHGTHLAIVAGLQGALPESVEPAGLPDRYAEVESAERLTLADGHAVAFTLREDLLFNRRKALPFHPNGMRFTALDAGGQTVFETFFYSVGGGFIVEESETGNPPAPPAVRYPFRNAAELVDWTEQTGLPVSAIVRENESAWRPERSIDNGLDAVWAAMQACVEAGLRTEGTLPGGLKIPRRAPGLYR